MNGDEVGYYSLQRGPESIIIDAYKTYIRSATFDLPITEGNIQIDIYVGYWVYNDGGFYNGTYFNQTYTIVP